MDYRTITVTPLAPTIGAEIDGVDLTKPLTSEQQVELQRALIEHLVIFFRNQKLDHESHKRFARYFGDIHIAQSTGPWTVPGHPEITRIHADADSRYVAGENWHSDMTCDPQPPMGSILHIHTLPSTGGDTVFASMYAAYDALSDRMKNYLEGMTAVHDGARVFAAISPPGKIFPRSVHPVIRRHPVTHRPALFVNQEFTDRLEGVSREESEGVLRFLYAHCTRPEFQCRFRWQADSVAFWDNRATQHRAVWDYFPRTRSGHRIQICGDVPA